MPRYIPIKDAMRRNAAASFSDQELTDMMYNYIDYQLDMARPPEGSIQQRVPERAEFADDVDELLNDVFGRLGAPENVSDAILDRAAEGLKEIVLNAVVYGGLIGKRWEVSPFANVIKEMIHDRIDWGAIVYTLGNERFEGGVDVGGAPLDFADLTSSEDIGVEPGQN